MPTTLSPRRTRKTKPVPADRVKRALLELAYRLHATKVVGLKTVPTSAG